MVEFLTSRFFIDVVQRAFCMGVGFWLALDATKASRRRGRTDLERDQKVCELVGASAALVEACETDFTDPHTTEGPDGCTDSETVADGEGSTTLTFGHIRRVRKALAALVAPKERLTQ